MSSKKKYKESCCHVLECHICSLAKLEVPRKSEVHSIIFFLQLAFLDILFKLHLVYYKMYMYLTFADKFFRSPKTKCHLLCQVGKTLRYDSSHNLFQSNLKSACC